MIRVIGLNQRSASIEVRERVTVSDVDLPDVLTQASSAVVLSTCNRTEFYLLAEDTTAAAHAHAFFANRLRGLNDADTSNLYDLAGDDALRHLFAVAAGLDSMVLGESQILGQIREGLLAATVAGVAGPVLTRVFREALRVGRRARHETFIARHTLSVSYAAVELARSVLGELKGRRVVIVGAGDVSELTAKALVENGVGLHAVVNRTIERARALTDRYGGVASHLDDIAAVLPHADIVIASTDSPHHVITVKDVTAAMSMRAERPLFIVDIALPRDVDPAVRFIDGVTLYDIDALKARCEVNRERRRDEILGVHTIIDEEVTRFGKWWESRSSVPTIVDLRGHADRIRREELVEALRRLPGLTSDQREVVEALTRAIVNKMLHRPTMALKEANEDVRSTHTDVVRSLFGLE